MRLAPSDELLLLARPRSAYRGLAARDTERGSPLWRAVRRPLMALVLTGAFVSLTTAGRFTLWHVVPTIVSWAFVPLIQVGWLLLLRERNGRGRTIADSIDLFFAGQGAWYAAGAALLAPIAFVPQLADRLTGFHWLASFITAAFIALAHGMVTTASFARHVWELPWSKALGVTGSYYLGVTLTIVGYYLVMGQLLPILGSSG